jgi:hypothetical protein
VNARDNQGRTALMVANCNHDTTALIKILLDAGADVRALDNQGKGVLEHLNPGRPFEPTRASMMPQSAVYKLLMDAMGTMPNRRGND